MKRKIYEVSKRQDGDWQAKARGTQRAAVVGETKAEVVDAARRVARNAGPAQLIIKKGNGRIQTEHTYQNDPERYPG